MNDDQVRKLERIARSTGQYSDWLAWAHAACRQGEPAGLDLVRLCERYQRYTRRLSEAPPKPTLLSLSGYAPGDQRFLWVRDRVREAVDGLRYRLYSACRRLTFLDMLPPRGCSPDVRSGLEWWEATRLMRTRQHFLKSRGEGKRTAAGPSLFSPSMAGASFRGWLFASTVGDDCHLRVMRRHDTDHGGWDVAVSIPPPSSDPVGWTCDFTTSPTRVLVFRWEAVWAEGPSGRAAGWARSSDGIAWAQDLTVRPPAAPSP